MRRWDQDTRQVQQTGGVAGRQPAGGGVVPSLQVMGWGWGRDSAGKLTASRYHSQDGHTHRRAWVLAEGKEAAAPTELLRPGRHAPRIQTGGGRAGHWDDRWCWGTAGRVLLYKYNNVA